MEVANAAAGTGAVPANTETNTVPESLERVRNVFCRGPLLDAVQRARLFPDSKTFVDSPLKADPEDVLKAFSELEDPNDQERLRQFVAFYFDLAGHDLHEWTPPDFVPEPPRLCAIVNEKKRRWALALNQLWKTLSRKQDPRVSIAPHRHSALVRRFGMVVPGGRFQETYYWDTYWILRGLIVCDMIDTARGMVENLLDDVRHFGFVPNGGRVYYLDRSQPPFLTEMVLLIQETSPDNGWLTSVLPVLEQEYEFWMDPASGHLSANIDGNSLNVYHSGEATPRPESYAEDCETAEKAAADLGRAPADVLQNLRAAAESGWDFSSRWLAAGVGGPADLSTVNTGAVIPVDLNCILYRVELGLARICEMVGASSESVEKYQRAAQRRAEAIRALLWVEREGTFRDYRVDAAAPSLVVSLSDYAAPLWSGLVALGPHENISRILDSLRQSGLLQIGGAATTTVCTGQQWDAPNAWAPIEHMLIEGLDSLKSDQGAQEMADDLAEAWLRNCLAGWLATDFMHEKYNAAEPGRGGCGGEYEPQIGFGWSNGVALVLLMREEGKHQPAAASGS